MTRIFFFLAILLTIEAGVVTGDEVKSPAQYPDSATDFEFSVQMKGNTVVFETVHGTNWKALSWAVGDEASMSFWLDDSGIASRKEDLSGGGFLLHFETTRAGAKMASEAGAAWKELGFGCGEPPCRFLVTENGVQGLN